MYNVLIKAGKANRNPVSMITMFEEIERERIVTPAELNRIFKAINESDKRYAHLKDMIVIGINTAMRKGEILGMKKGWVDFKNGIIIVSRSAQKRKKKDKRIPINSKLEPVLKRRMQGLKRDDYLFVNPKTGNKYLRIQNSWTKIIEKAGLNGKVGVDKLRFHDLRHTAATYLARAGKDIKLLAQYLGHTDVKTSTRYIHYQDEDLKSAGETLAELPSDFTTPKIVSM